MDQFYEENKIIIDKWMEYYELKKVKKNREYSKKYYEKYKDYYKKYDAVRLQKITCECGCSVAIKHLPRHKETYKHKRLIKKNTNTSN